MDSTEHIVCSQDIARVGPNFNHYQHVNQRGIPERHTVRPLPIPSTFRLIGVPFSVPNRIAAFCCKKYLQALTVNGMNTTT
jgi:hypothetical protein